ncbi:MAG: type II toxin-antitoxin system VapB family antitoxin [Lewinellaceae bacterium]|nr:type II toxin-antitoxin system VapB family antitoxin [Phaeodactylibacter sp.]MCB0613173.1 type II toxin-antitoxin system VapB family antitoxin [Phaeodactylibacter sp.]MCB9346355.1 type II toxin-antitoxin system VapB family antitoxin [Lewinellaceae bacterium]
MATNLDINPELLEEALKVGGLKTKKATVNKALEEFIQRRKQEDILTLFGSIVYDPAYDYKKHRNRK